jgi:hypothetical protein
MAEKRSSPVCFDADINLFAPVEEANNACNATTEETWTLPSTKVTFHSGQRHQQAAKVPLTLSGVNGYV